MKKLLRPLLTIAIMTVIAFASPIFAQDNYKHPHLNSSGQVFDSIGTKLGWVTADGDVYNAKGEKIATIKNQELLDPKGKKMGTLGKNGTFYDPKGAVEFTIEENSKGEECKVFDSKGKVIATVHENYKNQACAIHCLSKKMPAH